VLTTVKAIEAEGFRDEQLHQLALMLHDTHAPHPTQALPSREA
jgi:cation transport protein ChaC